MSRDTLILISGESARDKRCWPWVSQPLVPQWVPLARRESKGGTEGGRVHKLPGVRRRSDGESNVQHGC